MTILTITEGQIDVPRYSAPVFQTTTRMVCGRLEGDPVHDGFGMRLLRLFEKVRFWLRRISRVQATSCGAAFHRGKCDVTRITVTRRA
ncbi:hypothetical protein SAMN04488020_11142 [Palleronia marisminoris]|uniref:Uncharacterized protein n=1 Tax=Palleronia marisminoris TaxID=315423 RepID=A0A1Y5TF11_9RHOB|nr:hypothetical protein [Palleronia marisminoris]SFH37358.1 hypothetical protein SAMN04488020_11142 [Palleronia marisminoris]SLN62570.1 hypothetical protein PAM7066_03117 [Palleronia marisminoris]